MGRKRAGGRAGANTGARARQKRERERAREQGNGMKRNPHPGAAHSFCDAPSPRPRPPRWLSTRCRRVRACMFLDVMTGCVREPAFECVPPCVCALEIINGGAPSEGTRIRTCICAWTTRMTRSATVGQSTASVRTCYIPHRFLSP